MGRAHFTDADFLRAAGELAAARGPAAVTVGSVTGRLRAPVGSFYHRFASRDVLLGELWLSTVLAFQEGAFAALEAADGLAAALHTPRWARAHLEQACLLLLYHKHDFVRGAWPPTLRQRVGEQARRLEAYVKRFAQEQLGGTGAEPRRRAAFVLIDVPLAAVHPHLRRRQPPPAIVDELIRSTYEAVIGAARATRQPWRAKRRSP